MNTDRDDEIFWRGWISAVCMAETAGTLIYDKHHPLYTRMKREMLPVQPAPMLRVVGHSPAARVVVDDGKITTYGWQLDASPMPWARALTSADMNVAVARWIIANEIANGYVEPTPADPGTFQPIKVHGHE